MLHSLSARCLRRHGLRRWYSALPSNAYTNGDPSNPAVSSTPDVPSDQRNALDSALREMLQQEEKHLAVMNKLQLQHNVRPTIFAEVAKVAGFGLGAVTALMGKESAMACTEAVETVIGEHYDDQLKEMAQLAQDHASVPLLQDVIREFRDDELEHLDTAVKNFAQRAPAHALLSTVVGAGCKIAIELCKRV
ncbi:ubiquinone biosynthesis protein COQ7-domain-containing protein [Mucidula mucida]|nr:ubiquinone biosynthesis protein COQ7-domain-containing protein [Mucidula mucida]